MIYNGVVSCNQHTQGNLCIHLLHYGLCVSLKILIGFCNTFSQSIFLFHILKIIYCTVLQYMFTLGLKSCTVLYITTRGQCNCIPYLWIFYWLFTSLWLLEEIIVDRLMVHNHVWIMKSWHTLITFQAITLTSSGSRQNFSSRVESAVYIFGNTIFNDWTLIFIFYLETNQLARVALCHNLWHSQMNTCIFFHS